MVGHTGNQEVNESHIGGKYSLMVLSGREFLHLGYQWDFCPLIVGSDWDFYCS